MCAARNPVAGRDGLGVLDADEIRRALTRIAHEILERTHGGGEIILLGIPTRGVPLARRLAARIGEFEGLEVPCGSLDVTMHRDDLRLRPARALGRTDLPAGGAGPGVAGTYLAGVRRELRRLRGPQGVAPAQPGRRRGGPLHAQFAQRGAVFPAAGRGRGQWHGRAHHGEQDGEDNGLQPVRSAPQRVTVGAPASHEPAQPTGPRIP